MDLTDVSYAQAIVDLTIANNRVLVLSQKINEVSNELRKLQAQLGSLTSPAKVQTNEPSSIATIERRPAKAPSAFRQLFRSGSTKPKILTHIDEIGGVVPNSSGRHTVSLGQLRNLSISGWAVPTGNRAPFEFVEVKISGNALSTKKKVELRDRPDVAKHFGNASLGKSGFSTSFSLSELQAGVYSIEIEGGRTGTPSASIIVNEIEVR
ncbi:hypothetical protein [Rhizobium rhizogenes]|uniref:hypothetical protein n=1 Tax=Rhizobium rhizogenes TaxID=359 RepID=UPI00226E0E0A|nr:hypothetical protein [Rhizobium rhizogenes]